MSPNDGSSNQVSMWLPEQQDFITRSPHPQVTPHQQTPAVHQQQQQQQQPPPPHPQKPSMSVVTTVYGTVSISSCPTDSMQALPTTTTASSNYSKTSYAPHNKESNQWNGPASAVAAAAATATATATATARAHLSCNQPS